MLQTNNVGKDSFYINIGSECLKKYMDNFSWFFNNVSVVDLMKDMDNEIDALIKSANTLISVDVATRKIEKVKNIHILYHNYYDIIISKLIYEDLNKLIESDPHFSDAKVVFHTLNDEKWFTDHFPNADFKNAVFDTDRMFKLSGSDSKIIYDKYAVDEDDKVSVHHMGVCYKN